jgi:hypothetical protein
MPTVAANGKVNYNQGGGNFFFLRLRPRSLPDALIELAIALFAQRQHDEQQSFGAGGDGKL